MGRLRRRGHSLHPEIAERDGTDPSEHPNTTITRFNLVLTLRELDPQAAQPQIAKLKATLHRRPRAELSGEERQILDSLDSL